MSFREKSAWATLVALAWVSWSYFSVLWQESAGLTALASPSLPMLIKYTVGFIILLVVLHILGGLVSPNDAETDMDERERLIETKASHYAGMLLGAVVITALIQYTVLPPDNGNLLFYTILVGLIASQLLESLLIIFYHRWGI